MWVTNVVEPALWFIFSLAEIPDGCPMQKLYLSDGLGGSTYNMGIILESTGHFMENAELSCSLYSKLGPVPRKHYLYGINSTEK